MKIVITKNAQIIITIIVLFLFAFIIRAYDLYLPLITFDEHSYSFRGYYEVRDILSLSFSQNYWSLKEVFNYDSPPLGEYVYGFFLLLLNLLIPLRTYAQFLIASRIISVTLSSITSIMTFLITRKLFNDKTAVLGSLFYSLNPVLIAHNKISALETPLLFFFTLTILVFVYSRTRKNHLLITSIFSALTVSTKWLGMFIIPLVSFLYACDPGKNFILKIWDKHFNVTMIKRFIEATITQTIITVILLFLIWPLLWNNPLNLIYSLTFQGNRGEFALINWLQSLIYLLVSLFATTPALILLFSLVGLYYLTKKRFMKKPLFILSAWFLAPLLYSFFCFTMGGVRYVITSIPPLLVISAYGLNEIGNKLRTKKIMLLTLFYLIAWVVLIHPWYLDYYNELVGTTFMVYKLRLFPVAWWGEGLGSVMQWINKNAYYNSTIQFYVEPNPLWIPLRRDITQLTPSPRPTADYVVINTLCDWNNCSSGWYFVLKNLPNPLSLNVTYSRLEDTGYTLSKEISVLGAPLVRIYEKHSRSN